MFRRRKSDDVEILDVVIQVEDEPDVLKRIAVLNTAMFRILQSATRLVEVLSANYESGCVELRIQSNQRIHPSPIPSKVTVEFRAAPAA